MHLAEKISERIWDWQILICLHQSDLADTTFQNEFSRHAQKCRITGTSQHSVCEGQSRLTVQAKLFEGVKNVSYDLANSPDC